MNLIQEPTHLFRLLPLRIKYFISILKHFTFSVLVESEIALVGIFDVRFMVFNAVFRVTNAVNTLV